MTSRFAGAPKIANFLADSTDFGQIGGRAVAMDRMLDANAKLNAAKLQYTEDKAAADIEASKYGAQARSDVASAESQANLFNGIIDTVGNFGGGYLMNQRNNMRYGNFGSGNFGFSTDLNIGQPGFRPIGFDSNFF